MASATKGKGTTTRRRTKSTAEKAAATMQESNGAPPHNGVSEGGSYSEMKVEIIRARAYELFLGRGAAHGHDLADWLNAERELRARNP